MRRDAFGLIEAIMIMLMLGGILTLTLKYASISAKHIQDSYIKEQLELYMQSNIEKALLEISHYDRSGGDCYATYQPAAFIQRGITYEIAINMKKYYFFSGANESCSNVATVQIGTEESHGFVLMEIEANATKGGVLQARVLRRTLQRP